MKPENSPTWDQSAGDTPISLLAAYDDLIRNTNALVDASCEKDFLMLARNYEKNRLKWLATAQENTELKLSIERCHRIISDLEAKLFDARRLVDLEKSRSKKLEDRFSSLSATVGRVRELVFLDDQQNFTSETKEALTFLNTLPCLQSSVNYRGEYENSYNALNKKSPAEDTRHNTRSLLSQLSCSDDEDLSVTRSGKIWKAKSTHHHLKPSQPAKRKKSEDQVQVGSVEMQPGDHIVATTTVRVKIDGPVDQTYKTDSITSENRPRKPRIPKLLLNPVTSDEFVEPVSCEIFTERSPKTNAVSNVPQEESAARFSPENEHNFLQKTVLFREYCDVCRKKMKFGQLAFKCQACRKVCHSGCSLSLPTPCIPKIGTPEPGKLPLRLVQCVPRVPPQVPQLITACVREIERRGLTDTGLYRIPGLVVEVQALKEKFLRQRGVPNFVHVDTHVLCSTIKDFLLSLDEPLITHNIRAQFVSSLHNQKKVEEVILRLPRPNKDTLAFLMLHLQKVASSTKCLMPVENLAKVLSPTLLGHANSDYCVDDVPRHSEVQEQLLMTLFQIPASFWNHVLNEPSENHRFKYFSSPKIS